MTVLFPPLFPDFATPDLGCLVRRKHELQIEDGNANVHVEFVPYRFRSALPPGVFPGQMRKGGFLRTLHGPQDGRFQRARADFGAVPSGFRFGRRFHPALHGLDPLSRFGKSAELLVLRTVPEPAEVQWRPDAIMAHAYDI